MVSSKQQLKYVLAAIAAIGAKAEEGALQPAANVDANGNGVGKFGGPVFRRLGGFMSRRQHVEKFEEEDELEAGRRDVENQGELEAELETAVVKAEKKV